MSDELVENIWEPQHMDKIVPSLLFNMQQCRDFEECERKPLRLSSLHRETTSNLFLVSSLIMHFHHSSTTPSTWMPQHQSIMDSRMSISNTDFKYSVDKVESPAEEHDPPVLAEDCMRELVGRASFGHIKIVMKPVLRYFDKQDLWIPNEFAIHTFRIIMFSIQAEYSYNVVETLMSHLGSKMQASPAIRTSIAEVLSKIIAIAASESVGPSVLEIINSLLHYLRESVKNDATSSDTEETLYQEALINALGEFANHLPDYQKIEIMMFIMRKIPFPLANTQTPGDNQLQAILFKSLLKVGTTYQTVHFNTTFSNALLEPLLRMSLVADSEIRVLVQKILHTLLDRHRNLEKLRKPTVQLKDLDLALEVASQPDLIFMSKYGPIIFDTLYASLQMENNTPENVGTVYTTLALLCLESTNSEVTVDLFQLLLGIQHLALESVTLSETLKFNLHALVISLLVLISYVVQMPALDEYSKKLVVSVVECRVFITHLL